MLTLREVARLLGLSEQRVYHLDAELKPVQIPRGTKQITRLYRPESVEQFRKACACGCDEPCIPAKWMRYIPGHQVSATKTIRCRHVFFRHCSCEAINRRNRRNRRLKTIAARSAVREHRRKYPSGMWELAMVWKRVTNWTKALAPNYRHEYRMRNLRVAWRHITAWAEYANCSPTMKSGLDPHVTSNWFVYGLVDPRTQMIRYIGQSHVGMRRPREHRRNPAKGTEHYYSVRWVAKLKRLGLTYDIVILEHVAPDHDALNAAEVWWITYGHASKWRLTNLTDGGDGVSGRVVSKEERTKMSMRAKALWADPEYRAKVEASLRSNHKSELCRVAALERWQDPEYRRRWLESRRKDEPMNRPEVKAKFTGDQSPMRRPEVRVNHQLAMQRVVTRKRKMSLRRHWFQMVCPGNFL